MPCRPDILRAVPGSCPGRAVPMAKYNWTAGDWRMHRQRPGVGKPGSGGQVVGRWPPSGLRPAEASSSGAIKLLTNPGVPVRF